jgi:hypothetical protein
MKNVQIVKRLDFENVHILKIWKKVRFENLFIDEKMSVVLFELCVSVFGVKILGLAFIGCTWQ